jgi:hypothetical protein
MGSGRLLDAATGMSGSGCRLNRSTQHRRFVCALSAVRVKAQKNVDPAPHSHRVRFTADVTVSEFWVEYTITSTRPAAPVAIRRK